MDEALWNAEELAKYLKMAKGSIYHLVSQGRIPTVRLSARCIRFRPSEIAAWVESITQKEK